MATLWPQNRWQIESLNLRLEAFSSQAGLLDGFGQIAGEVRAEHGQFPNGEKRPKGDLVAPRLPKRLRIVEESATIDPKFGHVESACSE